MKTSNPHWTFHIEVLARALNDLQTTCDASPESAEFRYLRAEASSIFAEARDSLAALRDHMATLDEPRAVVLAPPTAH